MRRKPMTCQKIPVDLGRRLKVASQKFESQHPHHFLLLFIPSNNLFKVEEYCKCMSKISSRKRIVTPPKSFWQEYSRLILFAGGILAIALIMAAFQPYIITHADKDSWISQSYMTAKDQLAQKSFFWLFMISFIGSTILVSLPAHFFYVYYILDGADPWMTTLVAVISVSLGRVVNYGIGFFFSRFVRKKILKEDVKTFNKKFSKWGTSLLVVGNFIPFFPIEALTVFLGSVKFNFWKFLLWLLIGKLIELLLLVLFIKFFLTYGVNILTFNIYEFLKMKFF